MTLYTFLQALDDRKIHYELGRHRDETIMVKVALPGERWEVEFFKDGSLEVELFRSLDDGLGGLEAIERLLRDDLESS